MAKGIEIPVGPAHVTAYEVEHPVVRRRWPCASRVWWPRGRLLRRYRLVRQPPPGGRRCRPVHLRGVHVRYSDQVPPRLHRAAQVPLRAWLPSPGADPPWPTGTGTPCRDGRRGGRGRPGTSTLKKRPLATSRYFARSFTGWPARGSRALHCGIQRRRHPCRSRTSGGQVDSARFSACCSFSVFGHLRGRRMSRPPLLPRPARTSVTLPAQLRTRGTTVSFILSSRTAATTRLLGRSPVPITHSTARCGGPTHRRMRSPVTPRSCPLTL